jgi:hypothetical protein
LAAVRDVLANKASGDALAIVSDTFRKALRGETMETLFDGK